MAYPTYFNNNYYIQDLQNMKDRIEGKETYVGRSDYEIPNIYIEKGFWGQMLLTLKHELMHVWLYENGYKYQDGGCFTYEELCELPALANNFINRIVNLYKKFN